VSVPSVFMAVPMRHHDGTLAPKARISLDGAVEYAREHQSYDIHCETWGGASVTQNSFTLISKFLYDPKFKDCTHFLRTDDDMTYAPDAIQALLNADKPLIVGCYTQKAPPFWVCADVVGGSGQVSRIHVTREMLQRRDVCEIHGAGSGFMMVRREVMEDVAKLWKEYHEEFTTKMSEKFHGWEPIPFFPATFNGDKMSATDFSFCRTVRAAGHKLYMHCGVLVGHLWKKQISVLDHLSWVNTFGCSEQEQNFPMEPVEHVDFKVAYGAAVEERPLEPETA